MSSERKTIEHFLQISVHTHMKSNKEANFQKKTQNQSILGQITFGIQLQTFPQECNTRKLQPETWPIDEKVSFQLTMQLFSPTQQKGKEAVSTFLHLCLNNFWAPGPKDVCISKNQVFFYLCRPETHFPLRQDHHWRVIKLCPLTFIRTKTLQ